MGSLLSCIMTSCREYEKHVPFFALVHYALTRCSFNQRQRAQNEDAFFLGLKAQASRWVFLFWRILFSLAVCKTVMSATPSWACCVCVSMSGGGGGLSPAILYFLWLSDMFYCQRLLLWEGGRRSSLFYFALRSDCQKYAVNCLCYQVL